MSMAALGVAIVACGRSNVLYQGDAYGVHSGGATSSGGHAGTGGFSTGGTTGGTGAGGTTSTGGTFVTGGTGGSLSAGGTTARGGTGGVAMGGSSALAGASGMAGAGGFTCDGVSATCDVFTSYSTDPGATFGVGNFTARFVVFGSGLSAEAPSASRLHVTGQVAGVGSGIVLWFDRCSDLTAFSGIRFLLQGMLESNSVTLFLVTNSDYPVDPMLGKGACTTSDCEAPAALAAPFAEPVTYAWPAFTGGKPVLWDPKYGMNELIGIEWIFPYDASLGPYDVDVTLEDVGFAGGAGVECAPLGMGGMGGMSGGGGFGGFGGSGGNQGGFGGVTAGSAGTGGTSGGGTSGGGGTGGSGGTGGAAGAAGATDAGAAGA